MNKHRYRIVFNVARGIMMVVAEFVKAHVSNSGNTSSEKPILGDTHDWVKNKQKSSASLRPICFSLLLALGKIVFILPNSLSIHEAAAEIHADQSAPKNQQPVVLKAANGVEIVNIQTPNAAGVSRNTYSQFNVSEQGVIMNNSRTNVQTQLGGWVQGNPFINTPARVIFNEVNSSHPSYLNGYIEISGSRASFVLANPSGISCNGCGFINAYRATFTTGTPIFNGGDYPMPLSFSEDSPHNILLGLIVSTNSC